MQFKILSKRGKHLRLIQWHRIFAIWPRRVDDHHIVVGYVMRRYGWDRVFEKVTEVHYMTVAEHAHRKLQGTLVVNDISR